MTMLIDDRTFGSMGLVKAATLLPPTPLMLMAGSRALLSCQIVSARPNALIEAIFAAMVEEGLLELARLEAAVLASAEAAAAHGFGATVPVPVEVVSNAPAPFHRTGCSHCCGVRWKCDCTMALMLDKAAAEVTVASVGDGTGAAAEGVHHG